MALGSGLWLALAWFRVSGWAVGLWLALVCCLALACSLVLAVRGPAGLRGASAHLV